MNSNKHSRDDPVTSPKVGAPKEVEKHPKKPSCLPAAGPSLSGLIIRDRGLLHILVTESAFYSCKVIFPRVQGLNGLSRYLLVFSRHLLSLQGKICEDMVEAGEVQVELGFQV